MHPKYYSLVVWSCAAFFMVLIGAGLSSPSGEGSAGFLFYVAAAACAYFAYTGHKRGHVFPSSAQDESGDTSLAAPTPQNSQNNTRSAALRDMLSKGYQVDREGDGYIQFRKPRGSVLGNVIFFVIGLIMVFILPPIGSIILIVWFVRLLFLVTRPAIVTVSIQD
jgi:hypothetical protein